MCTTWWDQSFHTRKPCDCVRFANSVIGEGGVGTPKIMNWAGGCGPLPQTVTLFQSKICNFPSLFSVLTKGLTPFSRPNLYTYTIGVNRNWKRFCWWSYLYCWNSFFRKHSHFKTSAQTIPSLRPKSILYFRPKRLKKHTHAVHIHMHLFKGVPPPWEYNINSNLGFYDISSLVQGRSRHDTHNNIRMCILQMHALFTLVCSHDYLTFTNWTKALSCSVLSC